MLRSYAPLTSRRHVCNNSLLNVIKLGRSLHPQDPPHPSVQMQCSPCPPAGVCPCGCNICSVCASRRLKICHLWWPSSRTFSSPSVQASSVVLVGQPETYEGLPFPTLFFVCFQFYSATIILLLGRSESFASGTCLTAIFLLCSASLCRPASWRYEPRPKSGPMASKASQSVDSAWTGKPWCAMYMTFCGELP